MPLGRGVRSWFTGGAVVAVAVAVGAGLAQPWVSDPGSARAQAGGTSGASEAEVVETGIRLRYHVVAATPFQGGLVAVTSGGEVLRSRDGRAWRQVPTTGFTPRTTTRRENGEGCSGDTVRGVAAGDGFLVAVGQQAVDPEPGDEYCDARSKVWVSDDAATWRAVEPAGLESTDIIDAAVGDASGVLALGSRRPRRNDDGDDVGAGARAPGVALARRRVVGAGADRGPEQAGPIHVPVGEQRRGAR